MLGALACHAVIKTHKNRDVPSDSMVRHYDEVDENGWLKSARKYSNQIVHCSADEDAE